MNSIEQEKPAAILVDMEIPRMNGLELAGVDRYFTKPYQEDRLVDELQRLIK